MVAIIRLWGCFNIIRSMVTIRAELKAARQELGGYVVYVFKNLEATSWENAYKSVVKFPNWNTPSISIGEIGFLKFKEVIAGEDTWFDTKQATRTLYKYDNTIFIDFIREPKVEATIIL